MRSRRSPFDDLEPGTLRDELSAQEVAAERDEQRRRDEEQAALRARQGSQPLVFTGNGAEYFRNCRPSGRPPSSSALRRPRRASRRRSVTSCCSAMPKVPRA
jgi:hypothetical protein